MRRAKRRKAVRPPLYLRTRIPTSPTSMKTILPAKKNWPDSLHRFDTTENDSASYFSYKLITNLLFLLGSPSEFTFRILRGSHSSMNRIDFFYYMDVSQTVIYIRLFKWLPEMHIYDSQRKLIILLVA